MSNNNVRIEEVRERLGIKGILNVKKEKNVSKKKATRFDTKSFVIDYNLFNSYKLGEEFLMQEMSEKLREEGWKTSDISGQLYSKKNAGLLINRKPSEEEACYIGKSAVVWSLTELFFEKVREEMEEYEKLKASEETSEEAANIEIEIK